MKEDKCRYCMKDIHTRLSFYDFILQDSLLCGECKEKLEYINRTVKFHDLKLRILYVYNDFLEGMIFQYKEGRDIALQDVFFHDVKKEIIDKYRHYIFVLMPSSEEKFIERGFYPMRQMLSKFNVKIIEPFYKINNHKQSLQSFKNRQNIAQVIRLKEDFILPKGKLLLIDDVCTSGSTLLCAYDLLKEHKIKIEALVLCANPLFVESCDKKRLRIRL